MAIGTKPRWHGVRSGELEACGGVVEGAVCPQIGVVASLASGGDTCRSVIYRRDCVGIVGLMAGDAGCASQGVVVADVAIGTLSRRHHMISSQWKPGAVVIKRCIEPGGCTVAGVAGLREVSGDMVRISCAFVVGQVTGHAGTAVQGVVVGDVAVAALARRNGVHACQLESGGGVIEFRVRPLNGVVALLAAGRKSGMRNRRSRPRVVVLMATDAGSDRDVVVVVGVAIAALAGRNGVRAGQGETGFRMIECSRLPGRGVVASFTSLSKSAGDVTGVRGVVVILQMTGNASGACKVVVIADVAIRAEPRRNRVSAGQSEVNHRMIKARRGPGDGSVAFAAIRGKIRRNVVRV